VAAPTLLLGGATHGRAEQQAPEAQGMVVSFLVDDKEATRCVDKAEYIILLPKGTCHRNSLLSRQLAIRY